MFCMIPLESMVVSPCDDGESWASFDVYDKESAFSIAIGDVGARESELVKAPAADVLTSAIFFSSHTKSLMSCRLAEKSEFLEPADPGVELPEILDSLERSERGENNGVFSPLFSAWAKINCRVYLSSALDKVDSSSDL